MERREIMALLAILTKSPSDQILTLISTKLEKFDPDEIEDAAIFTATIGCPSCIIQLTFVEYIHKWVPESRLRPLLSNLIIACLSDLSKDLRERIWLMNQFRDRLKDHFPEDSVHIRFDERNSINYFVNGQHLIGKDGIQAEEFGSNLSKAVCLRFRTQLNESHVTLLRSLRGRIVGNNFVRVLYCFGEKDSLVIVTENHGQSLKALLDSKKPLEPRTIYKIFKGIASGMGSFHNAGHPLGDVNPSNIMVETNRTGNQVFVKLDLLRCYVPKSAKSFTDPQTQFRAPGVKAPKDCSVASDVYSFGQIMKIFLPDPALPFVARILETKESISFSSEELGKVKSLLKKHPQEPWETASNLPDPNLYRDCDKCSVYLDLLAQQEQEQKELKKSQDKVDSSSSQTKSKSAAQAASPMTSRFGSVTSSIKGFFEAKISDTSFISKDAT
eukprot:TRINITY_DN9363_c0_g1_i1.p1 TRINITY_DN9363_c0_g1~~TRINITY_DN9363_c0_g1_i1.p1  ORF type:complete len:457 (+),score=49.18 TRINITY_DN9363_c0_g1_i1:45-1373(+)